MLNINRRKKLFFYINNQNFVHTLCPKLTQTPLRCSLLQQSVFCTIILFFNNIYSRQGPGSYINMLPEGAIYTMWKRSRETLNTNSAVPELLNYYQFFTLTIYFTYTLKYM
jgi:hypothetical protein